MVRAPAQLRITRQPTGPDVPGGVSSGGPFLGRRGGPGGERKPIGRSGEAAPRQRERKKERKGEGVRKGGKSQAPAGLEDMTVEEGLSDGMVQQLLRLQRKEWDKIQYEPKYAHGSQAATQLIEEGKAFFEGEKPPPKVRVWTRLEKRIGIVGMHGA